MNSLSIDCRAYATALHEVVECMLNFSVYMQNAFKLQMCSESIDGHFLCMNIS